MRVLLIAPVKNQNVQNSGYATASDNVATILKALKERGDLTELTILSTDRLFKDAATVSKEHDLAIVITHPNSFREAKVSLAMNQVMEKIPVRLMCIFWETYPMPKLWEPLWSTEMFTGFLAPSYFIGSQLLRKTKKPVYYFPQYVDVHNLSRILPEDRAKKETFSVLFVGQNTRRKGLTDAVIGFLRGLGHEKDAEMIIKSHDLSDREVSADNLIVQSAYANMAGKGAPVYTITRYLNRQEISEMYASSSVLLFPSRGEGFGLPPAEAMISGIPVIYVPWSSTPEVCEAEGNYPLEYRVDEAHSMLQHGYEVDSFYAIPSIRDIMRKLRYCHQHWKRDRRDYFKSVQGNYDIIEKRFGKETVSRHYLHLIRGEEGFAPVDLLDLSRLEDLNREWDTLDKEL